MDPLICACQSNIPQSESRQPSRHLPCAPGVWPGTGHFMCFEVTRELPTGTRPVCEVHVSLLDIYLVCASESFVKRLLELL